MIVWFGFSVEFYKFYQINEENHWKSLLSYQKLALNFHFDCKIFEDYCSWLLFPPNFRIFPITGFWDIGNLKTLTFFLEILQLSKISPQSQKLKFRKLYWWNSKGAITIFVLRKNILSSLHFLCGLTYFYIAFKW